MNSSRFTMSMEELNAILPNCIHWPHHRFARGQLLLRDTDSIAAKRETTLLINKYAYFDCSADITLGSWCMVGRLAFLHTHDHVHKGTTPLLLQEEADEQKFTIRKPKTIEADCWFYQMCQVMAKCDHIAQGVVIAAGAIVTRPIDESYTIWAGVPARKIGMR